MIGAVRNALTLPDLRRKIVFTLMILVVYQAAAHIPVPGVDRDAMRAFLEQGQGGAQLLQILSLLSGGALANLSVLLMGVYPYITASIVIQLLTPLVPQLEELSKEGEQGRNRLNQYTHWLTVPLAALQAYGQMLFIRNSAQGVLLGFGFDVDPLGTVTTIIAMTAGTIFAVWLGELITEQGIGNGVSIIIFGGIVSALPRNLLVIIQRPSTSEAVITLITFVIITIVTVAVIVVVQEGQRRIPVQYGKRVRGTKVYGGQSSHIPLRVNSAGMIPIIFAQSILIFPSTVASYFARPGATEGLSFGQSIANWFVNRLVPNPSFGAWPYWLMYFLMVMAFTYFYTDIIFRQQNLADNLQRQGGFIPGMRPGKRTETYLTAVLRRITLVGAIFLGAIAILPWPSQLLLQGLGVSTLGVGTQTLLITSTGLLIVVGVVLDTMKQLEAQLLMRHYEGFIR
ncbi:MAG: preprotein translocase subunit SecY [Anaerolineae bacterium]